MVPLDVPRLPEYLQTRGLLARGETCRVEALSGGVSNVVLRIEPEGRPAFVVKQSRERLQTKAPWFSRLDRIFRETAVMVTVRPLLPDGAIPRILDEDRENYAYAMQAVDASHVVWKRELLAGQIRNEIAVRLAEYLSTIHGQTAGVPAIADQFADWEIFEQLRVDPFYRYVARQHPELSPRISGLIDEMSLNRVCLVHADFSPKNVLVVDQSSTAPGSEVTATSSQLEVTLIDFETGHYGDPAFDLGFFLSHLVLKGARSGADLGGYLRLVDVFWARYQQGIGPFAEMAGLEPRELERRSVAHLAACALSRIDGTSPVDYLTDPADRQAVREFGGLILRQSVARLAEATALLQDCLRTKSTSSSAAIGPSPSRSAPQASASPATP
jgi:5-methylthioribose kinase